MKAILQKLIRISKARSWGDLRRLLWSSYYDEARVRRLMEIAAASLIGETVVIYFRQPIVKGTAGQAYFDHRGARTIDLLPGREANSLLITFLHEISHHALHSECLPVRGQEIEQLFIREGKALLEAFTQAETVEYQASLHEREADHLAHYLFEIAKREASARFGSDGIEAWLYALAKIEIKSEVSHERNFEHHRIADQGRGSPPAIHASGTRRNNGDAGKQEDRAGIRDPRGQKDIIAG